MRKAVTFLLGKPSGEILMQLRDDGGEKVIPYPNLWCFPGGTKEEGESFLDCVIREIKEEYGLEISKKDCDLIITYEHDETKDLVYFCPVSEEILPILKEGADIKWASLDKIKKFDLAWEQDKILSAVEEYINNLNGN